MISMTAITKVRQEALPLMSVTSSRNTELPAVVGVPEIVAWYPLGTKLSPAGKNPTTCQVSGGTMPKDELRTVKVLKLLLMQHEFAISIRHPIWPALS